MLFALAALVLAALVLAALVRIAFVQVAFVVGNFVEGAPVNLTETVKSVRELVNGSPALLDSLEFEGGNVPAALAAAIALGGFCEI